MTATTATKIKTCFECDHCKFSQAPTTPVWYCELQEEVVPQTTRSRKTSSLWETEFKRIPMSCPRPDDEVEKRDMVLPCDERTIRVFDPLIDDKRVHVNWEG